MYKVMKNILLSFLFSLVCSTFIFAADEITITTYYPSPYGVYNTLRLYPNNNATVGSACTNAGEMFYSDVSNQVLVCRGPLTNLTWLPMSGTAGSIMYLRGKRVDDDPANCPGTNGWTGLSSYEEWGGPGVNTTRVCYNVTKSCDVMYLKDDKPLIGSAVSVPSCGSIAPPGEWIEADARWEWAGTSTNYVRTCYRCK
ncbi:MAG: hypothetical protein WC543_03965 [Candidatus Omnitrophota bacterium]